jgi:hypothetical protein
VDLLKAAPFMHEGVLEDLWDEIKSAVEALDHPVDIIVDLATQWHRGLKQDESIPHLAKHLANTPHSIAPWLTLGRFAICRPTLE